MKKENSIKHNIKAHNRVSHKYDYIHGEIFNTIEQERLSAHLKAAINHIETSSAPKKALDYGCGSGNLTKHMLDQGLTVVAADLSDNFLKIVTQKYKHTNALQVIRINGVDLSEIKSNTFDFVATYSVLHHVPDYLKIIKEIIRITKEGGVIYLDHEKNHNYWNKDEEYLNFLAALPVRKKKLKRFFLLSNYINKIRLLFNPRYKPEGDIHVWGDDHIDWVKIEKLLIKSGADIVLKKDYLLYQSNYPENIFLAFKNKTTDTRVLAARC